MQLHTSWMIWCLQGISLLCLQVFTCLATSQQGNTFNGRFPWLRRPSISPRVTAFRRHGFTTPNQFVDLVSHGNIEALIPIVRSPMTRHDAFVRAVGDIRGLYGVRAFKTMFCHQIIVHKEKRTFYRVMAAWNGTFVLMPVEEMWQCIVDALEEEMIPILPTPPAMFLSSIMYNLVHESAAMPYNYLSTIIESNHIWGNNKTALVVAKAILWLDQESSREAIEILQNPYFHSKMKCFLESYDFFFVFAAAANGAESLVQAMVNQNLNAPIFGKDMLVAILSHIHLATWGDKIEKSFDIIFQTISRNILTPEMWRLEINRNVIKRSLGNILSRYPQNGVSVHSRLKLITYMLQQFIVPFHLEELMLDFFIDHLAYGSEEIIETLLHLPSFRALTKSKEFQMKVFCQRLSNMMYNIVLSHGMNPSVGDNFALWYNLQLKPTAELIQYIMCLLDDIRVSLLAKNDPILARYALDHGFAHVFIHLVKAVPKSTSILCEKVIRTICNIMEPGKVYILYELQDLSNFSDSEKPRKALLEFPMAIISYENEPYYRSMYPIVSKSNFSSLLKQYELILSHIATNNLDQDTERLFAHVLLGPRMSLFIEEYEAKLRKIITLHWNIMSTLISTDDAHISFFLQNVIFHPSLTPYRVTFITSKFKQALLTMNLKIIHAFLSSRLSLDILRACNQTFAIPLVSNTIFPSFLYATLKDEGVRVITVTHEGDTRFDTLKRINDIFLKNDTASFFDFKELVSQLSFDMTNNLDDSSDELVEIFIRAIEFGSIQHLLVFLDDNFIVGTIRIASGWTRTNIYKAVKETNILKLLISYRIYPIPIEFVRLLLERNDSRTKEFLHTIATSEIFLEITQKVEYVELALAHRSIPLISILLKTKKSAFNLLLRQSQIGYVGTTLVAPDRSMLEYLLSASCGLAYTRIATHLLHFALFLSYKVSLPTLGECFEWAIMENNKAVSSLITELLRGKYPSNQPLPIRFIPERQLAQTLETQMIRFSLPQDHARRLTTIVLDRNKDSLNVTFDALLDLSRRRVELRYLGIHFRGEYGIDHGGLKSEGLGIIYDAIFSSKHKLFQVDSQGYLQVESPEVLQSHSHYGYSLDQIYFAIGRILGIAFLSGRPIGVKFNPLIYKILCMRSRHIYEAHVNLSYVKFVDSEVFKSLTYLKENDITNMDLSITFFVEDRHNLIIRGNETAVTEGNKYRFIELYVHYLLYTKLIRQYDSLLKGFHDMLGDFWLHLTEAEVKTRLEGNGQINVTEWKSHTVSRNPYNGSVVEWFWEVLEEMDNYNRLSLYKFISGYSVLPFQGFQGLPHSFTLVVTGAHVDSLPVAHTCFFQLNLPNYPTKRQVSKKLYTTLKLTSGFGLV